MKVEDMEKLKREWFETARAEGKFAKLCEIARHLGVRVPHNYGPKWEFVEESEDMRIYVDDYGNYMTVHDGARLVCSTHNEQLYIPDVCDPIIARHYPSAKEIRERKEAEKAKEKEAKLHKELFG